jgi:6-phosphogluconolactonase
MTSTVHAFAWDAEKGSLKLLQSLSTLPEPVKGNSTAECQVHPDRQVRLRLQPRPQLDRGLQGRRGDGKLTAAGHESTGGKTPRNFGIDPTGQILIAANQDSNNVVVFKIESGSGIPNPGASRSACPSRSA